MNTPPEDLVAGAVRHLAAQPGVAQVVAHVEGRPLVVQDTAPDRGDYTGACCVVVSHAGPAAGNDHNTWQQVRLQVEIWADPGRDTAGNVHAPALGRRRLIQAYSAVDRALHRPQSGLQWWGSVRTTDCERLAGLSPVQVPGTDGLWRGTCVYGVGIG